MSAISPTAKKSAWGAIEAGGTKFNCVLADEHYNILAHTRIPTTRPQDTLKLALDFFTQQRQIYALQAVGIASFGPVELTPDSPCYGFITHTPKPGWSHTNLVGYFRKNLAVPVAFQTDVNGAALGEWRFGAAQGCHNFVYVTIGTGIGAGVFSQGNLLQGISHPEVGHMLIPQKSPQDTFAGCCPFHGNCLEGLASGPAILQRWQTPAESLPAHHPGWELEAFYLAAMCVNITLMYAPQKIILGGGVMQHQPLFSLIHQQFDHLIAGYGQGAALDNLATYIVPAGVPEGSGILGALAMARGCSKSD